MQAEQRDGVVAGFGRPASSTMMPPASPGRPSSGGEQIMPSETCPYVLRAAIGEAAGQHAPGSATTTRSPAAKLWAPQTMPRGSPSPTSTEHQLIVLPFFCCSASTLSTRPDDERALMPATR